MQKARPENRFAWDYDTGTDPEFTGGCVFSLRGVSRDTADRMKRVCDDGSLRRLLDAVELKPRA